MSKTILIPYIKVILYNGFFHFVGQNIEATDEFRVRPQINFHTYCSLYFMQWDIRLFLLVDISDHGHHKTIWS